MKTELKFEDVWPIVECRDQWTEEKVREHTPVAVADLLDRRKLRHVSAEDRVWVLSQCKVFEPAVYRLALADVAAELLRAERAAGREPDPLSWEAVRVARRYTRGKATDEELENASFNAAHVAATTAEYVAFYVSDDDIVGIIRAYAATGFSSIPVLRRLAYWSKRS